MPVATNMTQTVGTRSPAAEEHTSSWQHCTDSTPNATNTSNAPGSPARGSSCGRGAPGGTVRKCGEKTCSGRGRPFGPGLTTHATHKPHVPTLSMRFYREALTALVAGCLPTSSFLLPGTHHFCKRDLHPSQVAAVAGSGPAPTLTCGWV